jgi:type I restriction enzyme S subunit
VTELPSGWQRVALADLGTWYGGGTPTKGRSDFWSDGTVPWLSPKDMGQDVIRSTQDCVTEAAVGGSAIRRVPAGSVAVVVRSGILERTLPIAVVPIGVTLNQDMKALAPRSDVDARWVAWGLRSREQVLLHECRKAGTTVASIETKRLLAQELPLPPLVEQCRIVEILEDHLSRLDVAATQVAAVGQRLETWRRLSVDKLVLERSSGTTSLATVIERVEAGRSFGGPAPPAGPDEWGIIKVSAMTWGTFRPEENKAVPADRVDPRFEIRPGDVLVSRANTTEYVGAPVLVPATRPRLLLSDKSLRLIPKADIDRSWLATVLGARSTRRQVSTLATGTKDSMRNISQSSLMSVEVPLADPRQQREVADHAAVIENRAARLHTELSSTLDRGQALRRALLAAAFSGQLTSRRTDEDHIRQRASVSF